MVFLVKPMKSIRQGYVLLILSLCFFLYLNHRTNKATTNGSAIYYAEHKANDEPDVLAGSTVRWTYTCSQNACIRREATELEETTDFEVCWLTCGTYGSVWPFPKQHRRSSDTVQFLPENIVLNEVTAESESVRQLIKDAFQIKKEYFNNLKGMKSRSNRDGMKLRRRTRGANKFSSGTNKKDNVITVLITTNQTDDIFNLSTDEAYEISIEEGESSSLYGKQITVKITGSTFFGVRHGIETFSQLVALDRRNKCLQILKSYYAYDKPSFPYRGILIDSARNFVPLDIIRRVVDGMAINKLNILHIHLSDSNTFPFHSQRVPQMTEYGTFSQDQIYYADELKELVKYARVRGVKVIPELDAPSHAGNGWQFGNKLGLGDLAFYVNDYDSWEKVCGQPPCGILNPVNNNTYDVLENLYADLLEVFDNDLFHMGGDEVNLHSWEVRPELKEWLSSNQPMDLWKYFQTEAFRRLREHSTNVTAILWTSHLTDESDIDKVIPAKDYIIQVWGGITDKSSRRLFDKGYSIIVSVSNQLYLDWGCGTWLGKNQVWNYLPWQTQYDSNRKAVQTGISEDMKSVLGAEGTLWGEKVGFRELEVKLWPRAAAIAESFWSNPTKRDGETYTRINYHNYRLRERGIPSNQLQPESCLHFRGHCEDPSSVP